MRKPAVLWLLALPLIAALALGACSRETPEQKLEEAAKQVKDARGQVHEARKDLSSETEDADRERAQLEEARTKLYNAQSRLSQAASTLEQRATDVALFRIIQRALLDEKGLESSAVVVHVKGGAVTLYGTVPDQQARERAVRIAKSTPGVQDVASNVEVAAAPAPPNADASVNAGTPSPPPAASTSGFDARNAPANGAQEDEGGRQPDERAR
jgi:hypothetical protein